MKRRAKPQRINRKRTWYCESCGAMRTRDARRDLESDRRCMHCASRDVTLFDSRAEAKFYAHALRLVRAGEVATVKRQHRFPITINGVRVATLVIDFVLEDKFGNRMYVDVKGRGRNDNAPEWRLYRLKRDIVQALYGVEIEEVFA